MEELDATLTDGYLTGQTKSKQLFIFTGLTTSYAYNDITFAVVPAGSNSQPLRLVMSLATTRKDGKVLASRSIQRYSQRFGIDENNLHVWKVFIPISSQDNCLKFSGHEFIAEKLK